MKKSFCSVERYSVDNIMFSCIGLVEISSRGVFCRVRGLRGILLLLFIDSELGVFSDFFGDELVLLLDLKIEFLTAQKLLPIVK